MYLPNDLESQIFISQEFCIWTWQHRPQKLSLPSSLPTPDSITLLKDPGVYTPVGIPSCTSKLPPDVPRTAIWLATLQMVYPWKGRPWVRGMSRPWKWAQGCWGPESKVLAPWWQCTNYTWTHSVATNALPTGKLQLAEPQKDLCKLLRGLATASLCVYPF